MPPNWRHELANQESIISVEDSAVEILPANASRSSLLIRNQSDVHIYVSFLSASPVMGQNSLQLKPDESYWESSDATLTQVSAIAPAASSDSPAEVYVREIE